MKILFVGQLGIGQTSRMRMDALTALGHVVVGIDSAAIWSRHSFLSRRLQQHLALGPAVNALNREIVETARRERVQLLWAEKQEYVRAETLRELSFSGVQTLHYTPDPYFTLAWKRTRLIDSALPLYDHVVTSKSYELPQYRAYCRNTIYMALGYAPDVHRPLAPAKHADMLKFSSDATFVGGWEPRRESLLTRVAGIVNLKVWGFAWDHVRDGRWTPRRSARLKLLAGSEPYEVRRNEVLAPSVIGDEIYGDEYAYAVSCGGIGIGFLRRVCPDQHTTRTFEIPACGSMLLADRTEEHQSFFAEGAEAEYFGSDDEFIDKLRFYASHEEARARVARNGFERCTTSGYDYGSRLSAVLRQIDLE